jgi:glycosyltransferase involved in cell wall biosynthesis
MLENNATISVIIPTYNRAHLLKKSIDSVLNQTYANLEVIVIDDNSSDNTDEVLNRYNDERIRYIKNKVNRGASDARNQGIEIARGEYLTFLDSDDELFVDKLEKQVTKFSGLSNKYGLVYCGYCFVSSEKGEIEEHIFPELYGNVYSNLLTRNIFPIHAPVVKRECFKKCGIFDTSLPACEDWDIWIRVARHYEFAFVPEILAKYYIHGKQKSTEMESVVLAREKIVEKYRRELHHRPHVLARHQKEIALLYCLNDEPAKGRKYFLSSIRSDPFHYWNYVHLALSLLSNRIHKNVMNKFSFLTIGDVRLTF